MEKKNISSSQRSSGCESGWTLYLDQSYISENQVERDQSNIVDYEKQVRKITEEEEEEDLSMVSDASSGPPQYYNNKEEEDSLYENGYSFSFTKWASKSASKGKMKKEKSKIECSSQLDDTASSPVYQKNSTSRNNVWGFSATQFQGESTYEKQFSLMQPSQSKNPASEETRYFKRGDWE